MDTEQSFEPDKCCAKALAKVLESLATAERWECPKCGCEWRPNTITSQIDGNTVTLRHWTPRPFVAVFPA